MKRSAVPAGFVELRLPKQIWWVKAGWDRFFPERCNPFRAEPHSPAGTTASGGRGAIQRIPLDGGGHAIVRRYRRGGFVRHFVNEMYWDRPFRPLAELACTETARQRGVPTVEVLAAGIERMALGLYRGLLLSREAEGFVNLWEWLQEKPSQPTRTRVLETIGQTIARMHAAGVYHADLNLTNILVRLTATQPEALIIDFDRARVFSGALTARRQDRVLRRFQRSLDKLDPHGVLHSAMDVNVFCQAYRSIHVKLKAES
jgi:3-deoxy-D-manno-octulosonic acid kinase